MEVPYAEIDTVFLDVGNTLISIDFDWVSREVGARGFACEAAALRRAEAAARPELSDWISQERSTEAPDTLAFYLAGMLARLDSLAGAGSGAARRLADELLPVLRTPGQADRLWRYVLPGVPEALETLRGLELQLVVVSNSDGSAERGLRSAGLVDFFEHVVDSGVVGFEKPDPRIFEHALGAAGADAARALHVGDLFHADVTGARAAGVHAVLLDPFDDWGEVDCERMPDLGSVAQRLRAGREAA